MKLLHFADAHIGVENHGRIDPVTGLHTRLLDFVASLTKMADLAVEQQVDAVLFAGDGYRVHDPNPTHQREFARQIKRLSDAGIPTVMVVGNHDHPVAYGRASALDIFRVLQVEHVTVFNRPGLQRISTRSGPLQVAGLPWPHRSLLLAKEEYKQLNDEEIALRIEEIMAGLIEHLADQVNQGIPAVLLAHLSAATAIYSGSERTAMIGREPVLLPGVLANPAFDYVALGHIHRFQDLNQGKTPPVVYSGSLDRVDFGEEGEEKGFCLVEIAGKGQVSYRHIPIPVRPFVTIRLSVKEGEDPTVKLLAAIAAENIENAVVRVFYTVSDEQLPLLNLRHVQDALAGAHLVTHLTREPSASERLRRAEVSRELATSEALQRYLLNHPELKPLERDLLAYAAKIEEKWQQGVRE